jgi:alpha-1,2-mannosyltransferase
MRSLANRLLPWLQTHWRWLLVGSLIVLVAFTAIRYYAKASKPSRLGEYTRTAFLRWRPQLHAIDRGADIYREFNYPNPPIMALTLYPLAQLPAITGGMVWFVLKVLMALFIVAWAVRIDMQDWARALALLMGLHPLLGDLSHGNVNIYIGFLVIASLALFWIRWNFTSGVVLALAIACKVTPALFVPYFVWKRAWRTLAGVGVGLAMWLAVVPGCVLGWDYNRTLLTSWFDTMVKPFVIDGKVTSEHPNQSLPGLAFRLLSTEPSFLDYDDDDGRPIATASHTLLDLGPRGANWVVKGLMGLYVLAIVYCCRVPTRAATARRDVRLLAEFAIVIVGMLLFSERTWKHHGVLLVMPFAVIFWAIANNIWRRTLVGVVGLIAMLMWLPGTLTEAGQDLALVYGTHTCVFVLVLLSQFAILHTLRTQAPYSSFHSSYQAI